MQVGAEVNIWVGCEEICIMADLQQIWRVQSLFWVQICAHVAAQRPLQQSGADCEVQSIEVVQVSGQLSYFGFRHRPDTFRLGSRLRTEVQQISPDPVSHSALVEQAWGHCEAGRQKG